MGKKTDNINILQLQKITTLYEISIEVLLSSAEERKT